MKKFHISIFKGGLKIWECTEDLLDYLEKEAISFKDMNVLDLGCGAGVLGIQAVHREACSVHFQDYVIYLVLHSALISPNHLLIAEY